MIRETELTHSEAPIDVTDQMEHEGTLTDQVHQEERGRLMGYFGRAAARVALVGAVFAGALTGQGHDQDEAPVVEATPALVAAESCTKGGVQGTKIGDLCVTREKAPQPQPCSKADRLIGAVSVGVVTNRLRLPAKVAEYLGYGWAAKEIYTGDLCD